MTKGDEAGSPVRLRTLREIERVALLHMDPVITEFLQGGSGAELTLERNRSDFDRIRFVPRVMSGCALPLDVTTVAGIDLRIPVMTAPFGAEGYFHPDGHLAVARANARFGIVSVVPEAGTYSAEQVAGRARRRPRSGSCTRWAASRTSSDGAALRGRRLPRAVLTSTARRPAGASTT